jgi:hypothetical protein
MCVCVCVIFCCKLGKNFTGTFQLLNQTYRADCISQMQCYEWFKRFKDGRMLVSEDSRPGWLSTSTNEGHINRFHAVFRGNRHLTLQEVADKLGISIESCHQIFTVKLQMCHVSAKFMLTHCSSSAFIWQNIRHPLYPIQPIFQT